MRTAAKLFGVVAILVSSACSSSSTPTPPAGPTADAACTSLAAAYCAKADSCSPLIMQFSYADVATCKDRFKTSCLNGLKGPGSGSTPQRVSDCSAAASSIACGDLFYGQLPDACKPVAGTLADGSACGDDSQCVSKFCSANDKLACGKCGAPPAEGAACGIGAGKCAPGMTCNDTTNKCVTPAKTGEACSADKPCQVFTGQTCNDGKCGAAAKPGEACNTAGTGKPQCDLFQGYVCIPAKLTDKDGTCQAIKWAATGAKCGIIDPLATPIVYTGCSAVGTCRLDAAPKDYQGTCVAPAKDGEACDSNDKIGPKCVAPSVCTDKKCVFPDASTCK